MANQIAFQVYGNTFRITATTTTGNIRIQSTSASATQYLVSNLSAQAAYGSFGTTSSVTAVVPAAGSSAAVFLIPGSSSIVWTGPPSGACWLAVITETGTSDVHCQPGEGL